jgi:hypothetical protein
MNDSDTSRTWTDFVARCGNIANRNAAGEIPVWAHIIVGWDAFFGPGDVAGQVYKPFITGTTTATVTAGELNHWLFDGQFASDALVIVNPVNRATIGAASATNNDSGDEGLQREYTRNYSHALGYTIGLEQTTHEMQGAGVGTLPSASQTHPENNDYQGDVEMAVQNGHTMRMVFDPSYYPGPMFFDTIRAGSAANKVIVSISGARPNPGEGLSEGATGFNPAGEVVPVADLQMHTKQTGGDPGVWFEASIDGGSASIVNVTSGTIIDAAAGEVELTLSSTPTTSVSVWYSPGTPGSYPAGTVTQDALRAGALFVLGTTAPDPITSIAQVRALGFAVAGTNQALTLTL